MKLTSTNILVFLLSINIAVSARAAAREFTYHDNSKRNPFISLVTREGRILPGARAASETDNFELEGIIWDPSGKSMAIINGKLVKEKQRIMGMQVLKIKKSSVILQKGGKVTVINLKNLKKGGESSNGKR